MNIPLPILRKRADEALNAFVASSGFDPEEVWGAMLNSNEKPEILEEHLGGDSLWGTFEALRREEINTLKNLRRG